MPADDTQRQPTTGFRAAAVLISAGIALGGVVWWQYAQWNIRTDEESAAERHVTDQQAFEEEIRGGARAVPALIEKLASSDSLVRKRAVFALERIGPDAVEAYPALVKLLDDDDPWFRAAVLEALGNIGHDRESLAPRAAEMLTDDKTEVFEAATRFLLSTGPAVVPYLRPLLAQDEHIALRALQLLHRLEADDEETLQQTRALRDRSEKLLRSAATIAILDSGKGTDDEIREALRLALSEREPVLQVAYASWRMYQLDDEVAAAGVTAIERRGKEGQRFLPDLLAILGAKHRHTFLMRVCNAIAPLAPDEPEVMARLQEAARAGDRITLEAVGKLILRLGGDNSDLAELVLERERLDKEGCLGAASLLCSIAPHRSAHWLLDRPYDKWRGLFDLVPDQQLYDNRARGPEAMVLAQRVLASLRQTRGGGSVKSDLRVFEWLGPSGAGAAPFLCELFEELARGNTRYAVPDDVVRVFRSMGPAASGEIPRLLRCYQRVRDSRDLTPSFREFLQVVLLESLQALGKDRSWLQAEATPLVDSTDLGVQVRGAALVLSLDPNSEESFVRLIEALHDSPYPSIQIQAIQTLAREGRRSAAAIEPLTLLLDHTHQSVSLEAVRALAAICRPVDLSRSEARPADDFSQDPLCALAVAALARALESRSRDMRRAAVEALAQLGPAASAAVPDLERAASDWRNGLRHWNEPYRNEDASGSLLIEQYTGSKRMENMRWQLAGADVSTPTVREAVRAALKQIQLPVALAPAADLREPGTAEPTTDLSK